MEDYSEEESDDFFINILVIMMVAIWIAFDKKTPRYTQLISFWFNTHSNKTILEIKTGEGKTMIVAMTALYYALRGKKVDVFTSSSALATTETRADSSVRKFFELFNITLGNNCQIGESRAKVYENQVIYGTSFEFQGDYLRKIFCGDMAFFKGRDFDKNHVAILDEVDALLIDRMTDSTRISSRKPLFDAIKAIFILIHEIKFELIKAKGRFCGQLKVKILGK
jgi:preprotein translocase subunit SecA